MVISWLRTFTHCLPAQPIKLLDTVATKPRWKQNKQQAPGVALLNAANIILHHSSAGKPQETSDTHPTFSPSAHQLERVG